MLGVRESIFSVSKNPSFSAQECAPTSTLQELDKGIIVQLHQAIKINLECWQPETAGTNTFDSPKSWAVFQAYLCGTLLIVKLNIVDCRQRRKRDLSFNFSPVFLHFAICEYVNLSQRLSEHALTIMYSDRNYSTPLKENTG